MHVRAVFQFHGCHCFDLFIMFEIDEGTEIRASSLSGECSLQSEIGRGNYLFAKGHQECVKRRAALSVAANIYCKNNANEAVDAVFDKCYGDCKPFDEKR